MSETPHHEPDVQEELRHSDFQKSAEVVNVEPSASFMLPMLADQQQDASPDSDSSSHDK